MGLFSFCSIEIKILTSKGKAMKNKKTHISRSLEVLDANLFKIAQVEEWAGLMGYTDTKKFSREFLRYYLIRPCRVLNFLRLKSIYTQLKLNKYSNFQIALHHSLPDEKALNKYVKYHLGCCPRELKLMRMEEASDKLKNSVVKLGNEKVINI